MADHECAGCGESFATEEELARHRNEHPDHGDAAGGRLKAEKRLGGPDGIRLGPESGSTADEQMASGLGDADMGAVDERIDLGTTLDTGPTAEELEGRGEVADDRDALRCEHCGAAFGALADLQRHYEQEHGEMRRVS
jgi:uncharacterized C2H2 Zn-finger protein